MLLTQNFKAMLNFTAFLLSDHSGVCAIHLRGRHRVNEVKEENTSGRPWSEAAPYSSTE